MVFYILLRMINFWKKVKKCLPPELNQTWLCEEIGVSTGTMSSWITNDRIPKMDVGVRIAKALGVTAEYLINDSIEEQKPEIVVDEVSRAMSKHAVYVTPKNQEFPLKSNDEVVMLPVLDQKVSAGYGAIMIEDQFSGHHVPVLRRLVSQYDLSTLKAVEVRGDSMTGVNMFNGDIVIFAAGYVSMDGIYVLTLNGDVLVKRIEFDSVNKTIKISSENPRYPDVGVLPKNYENVEIHGKVVAWFHCHPY